MRHATTAVTLTVAVVLATAVVRADQVTLTTGDLLHGQVIERNDTQLILNHPVLGELTIPADQVEAVTIDDAEPATDSAADSGPEPESAPEPAVAAPPAAAADVPAPAEAPVVVPPAKRAFLPDWDLSFALGFSGADGNSDNQSFNAAFSALKEDERDRWIFDANYFYSTSDGDRTQNEFLAELTKDWLMPESPWFLFARAGYEYDEFEFWEQRVQGFGGVGYTFLKQDEIELIGRVGAGVTQELDGDEQTVPEGLISASMLRWHITPNQNLTASATLFPDLGDLGEFRVTSTVEWTIELDQANGLSLKFGLENEYESETEDDTQHNDLKYYGALVLEF